MSPPSEDRVHHLEHFTDFLSAIDNEGFEFVIIGGCAVGAYGHLLDEPCLTTDLDVLVTPEAMTEFVNWARSSQTVELLEIPKPRSLQVAVMRWGGLEVNVLTRSRGLPPAGQTLQNARIFKLKTHRFLQVPIADPFDLLSNKLSVNRDKDRPHIALLQKFITEEIVATFAEEATPRQRLAPVRRLLRVLGQKALPSDLSERLLPLATTLWTSGFS